MRVKEPPHGLFPYHWYELLRKIGVRRPLFSRPHPLSVHRLPIKPPKSRFYKQVSSSTGRGRTEFSGKVSLIMDVEAECRDCNRVSAL